MNSRLHFIFLMATLLSGFVPAFAGFTVKMVSPSAVLYHREVVSQPDKGARVSEISTANNLPLFAPGSAPEPMITLNALIDDVRFLAFDIIDSSSTSCNYKIETNIPPSWALEIRRQAMITDWYVTRGMPEDIDYYGDALTLLARSGESWTIPMRQQDVSRLNMSFRVASDSLIDTIKIMVTNLCTNQQIEKQIPIQVYNTAFPDMPFNSIIFDQNGLLAGGDIKAMWQRYGFTHFQIHYKPSFTYDDSGNIDSYLLDDYSTNQFFSTANEWAAYGNGGAVALSWSQPFVKTGGGNLEPYTDAWMNAYAQTVRDAAARMRGYAQALGIAFNDTEKVVLYVADEIGTNPYSDTSSPEVRNVRRFLDYLELNMPEYKTLVTFGYASGPADIDIIKPATDILVPHMIMPDGVPDGLSGTPTGYSGAQVFKQKFCRKNRRQASWAYTVESGKNSDIKDFRLLPAVAALNGFQGMSWWAFQDYYGSPWLGNDGNMLDYSLVYFKDNSSNYNYWMTGMNTAEYFTPSTRIWSAGAGLQDARLLRYLLNEVDEQTFINSQISDSLQIIKEILGQLNDDSLCQPDRNRYFSLDTMELVSWKLRELYNAFTSSLSPVAGKAKLSDLTMDVRIYPNPAKDILYIEQASDKALQVLSCRLLNMHGQVLYTGNFANRLQMVSLAGFMPGLYIIEIRKAGSVQREKVVIR